MTATPYFCQGHATTCLACLDPDFGGCEGHGAISYCDGTCASAQQLLVDDIHAGRVERPAQSTTSVALGVMACDGSSSWVVTFTGPQADAWATAYVTARRSTHVVDELADRPFSSVAFPRLSALLYPVCHHGMDGNTCMDDSGPHHWGTRDWEMAFYGE